VFDGLVDADESEAGRLNPDQDNDGICDGNLAVLILVLQAQMLTQLILILIIMVFVMVLKLYQYLLTSKAVCQM
jgi:hypothetical protein